MNLPEEITIVHISDLHFGSDHGFAMPGKDPIVGDAEFDLADVIATDIELQHVSAHALVVSGDIVSHATWKEHRGAALSVLGKLADRLGIPRECVYIVPGNHDYEWYERNTAGTLTRKMLKPDTTSDFTHEVHFNAFIERFYGQRRSLTGEVFKIRGEGFSLKMGLMDSCKLVASQFHEYGYLSFGQIKDVMRKFEDDYDGPEIRAVVLHHHLNSIVPAEPPRQDADVSVTLDACRLIDRALDTGVGLVLHGHQHYPCVGRVSKSRFLNRALSLPNGTGICVVSAGSAGVRRDRRGSDVPNTYSILSLGIKASKIKIRAIFADGEEGSTLLETALPVDVYVRAQRKLA